MSKATNKLLQQYISLPQVEVNEEVDDIIKRSKAFPIPFPIDSVRLEKLKMCRPVEKLKENIVHTYPIIHERVLVLMTQFLMYKREFGSSIEKALYKDMSVPVLVDRILTKRAAVFMKACDDYKLLTGEQGKDGWESVGTLSQKPPLVLENCLSYDEMKLSAMVYVNGPTECINDGARHNGGVVCEDGVEKEAIIIGIVGPRFKRIGRMEYEDIIISKQQNIPENGYGNKEDNPSRRMWRKMWADFYQVQNYTYHELTSTVNIKEVPPKQRYIERYIKMPKSDIIFDNEVYYKRLCVTAECVLLEADERAKVGGRQAFLNVIGAGLGVWKISTHQLDVYILTFLERIRALLDERLLDHVTDVNFAYIKPSKGVLTLFLNKQCDGSKKMRIFLKCKNHPRGGINVQLENREPSSKLSGEHAGKLLVMTYPWDGNAHPGNEFWKGKLSSSGDPAAACSTQISELHNAHINLAVTGPNTRVAGRSGVKSLSDCCAALTSRKRSSEESISDGQYSGKMSKGK